MNCKARLWHIAACNSHSGLAQSLLDWDATPNTGWNGRLPAQIAEQQGHSELTLLLKGNSTQLQQSKIGGWIHRNDNKGLNYRRFAAKTPLDFSH